MRRAIEGPRGRRMLALLAAVAVAGCDRVGGASGPARSYPRAEATGSIYQQAPLLDVPGVDPGNHPQVILGVRTNPYARNPSMAANGRLLFVSYNCSGCHGGHGGGGMGPSLRDSVWIFGDSDTDLLMTITGGRPTGMPAWGPRVPEQQIWMLITYIHTLGTTREPDPPPPPAYPALPIPSYEQGLAASKWR